MNKGAAFRKCRIGNGALRIALAVLPPTISVVNGGHADALPTLQTAD
jgi:hypothetical protein